ncbi:MAG: serine kinase [Phycisphaerae bacterium]|nr:serine kinase [Phycisphaerae bacterium]
MKLADLVNTLGLEVISAPESLSNEVTGGYVSDLLSDVIGNARQGDVWITLQGHVNVVAVASMKELAGIILVSSRKPDEDAAAKAEEEGIVIMVSELPAFEVVGRLYGLGVRGAGDGGQDPGPT